MSEGCFSNVKSPQSALRAYPDAGVKSLCNRKLL